ncbi:unnamed protein product, partial [Rotaria sp. Silwood1]
TLFFDDRKQCITIERSLITSKKVKTLNFNLTHEAHKLLDFTVVGILEDELLTTEDFDIQFNKRKR